MSTNAIAPSANLKTVSVQGEENFPFRSVLERLARENNPSGLTRDKWNLKFNKLFASLCREYRATFAAIYPARAEDGSPARLPSVIADKIKSEVETFINAQMLAFVNVENVTHQVKSFAFDKDLNCFEKVQIVGKNTIALQEQALGHLLKMGQLQKQLDKLDEKPLLEESDRKRMEKLTASLKDHEAKRAGVLAEIKRQATLA